VRGDSIMKNMDDNNQIIIEGDLELSDIIDAPDIQLLIDSFYELVPVPMAMIDINGKVLVGAGWQDICTKFHRVHPETSRYCIESDTQLSSGVPQGEFKLYKCKNGMWDIATPIIIGGKHLGNLFSGQFFFDDEPLDYEYFRSQARKYGFDEDEYIAALERVPRISKKRLDKGMAFYTKLADMLSRLSYSNIRLERSLYEREVLTNSLREGEERLKRAQEIAHLGSWELDLIKNELTWSDEVYRIFGLIPQEFSATYEAFLERVHPEDRKAVDDAYTGSLREGRDTYEIEHRIVRKGTGEIRYVHERCEHIRDESGKIVRSIGMVHDITERKQAEQIKQDMLDRERHITEVLQGTLVPQELPRNLYGCELAVKYQPALREAEIGGDFFDVFDLGNGKLGIIIGDVAGKGLKAAVRVAEARYSVRCYAYEDPCPGQVLMRVNEILCNGHFDEGSMLTAFFAVIDTNSNTVTYANAAHEPPIVIGTDCIWHELQTTGLPLGIMKGISYAEQVFHLNPGDRIVMITDGISEARAEGVVLFEKRGVIEYLVENYNASPSLLIGGLLDAAIEHAGGQLQDDAALVVFECADCSYGV